MSRLSSLYNSGYHAAAIAKQLGGLLRKQLVQKQSWAASALGLQLLQHLIEVPSSPDPERFLEIVLLRAKITAPLNQAKVEAPETVDTPEPQPLKEKKPEVEKQSSKHKAPTEPQAFSETTWPEVLGVLKQRHNTLYGLVRMAQPSFSEKDKLILTFSFAFHEKRIKEANNRRLLADIIHELTGQIVSVDCVLDKNLPAPKTVPIHKESPPKPDLAAISNIFGGAELLES